MENINKEIKCPKCEKSLGWFDGKVAKAEDGVLIKAGIIYFSCSRCGEDVEVCPNDFGIKLEHQINFKSQ